MASRGRSIAQGGVSSRGRPSAEGTACDYPGSSPAGRSRSLAALWETAAFAMSSRGRSVAEAGVSSRGRPWAEGFACDCSGCCKAGKSRSLTALGMAASRPVSSRLQGHPEAGLSLSDLLAARGSLARVAGGPPLRSTLPGVISHSKLDLPSISTAGHSSRPRSPAQSRGTRCAGWDQPSIGSPAGIASSAV